MYQPPVSKNSEKRKSLGATGRNILRAISAKQSQQIKSSSAGSPGRAPELTNGKLRRATQGSTEATLGSPPASPYRSRKAGPPTLTAHSPTRERKISRSASAARDKPVISPSSAPQSPRAPHDRESFATPARIPSTFTSTSTATISRTTGTGSRSRTQVRDSINTPLSPSAQLARIGTNTSAQTTTLNLAQTVTPEHRGVLALSPSGTQAPGASKHARPGSSPSRLQTERTRLKESELNHAQWRIQAKKASALHLAQYDAPADGDTKLKPDPTANDSTSSNAILSPSDSRTRSRKLERRPSVQLSHDRHIVKVEPSLPYPALASEWINESHYGSLTHAAKLMMLGLSHVRGLHEQGEQSFGLEWAWNTERGHPLGEWARRGTVERKQENEVEYFDGRENFERLYEKGKLAQFFEATIKSCSAMPPGPERAAAILKLARQTDHVLNLALENLRLLTLRTDILANRTHMYWEVMTTPSLMRNDIELMTAHFGDRCVTVQAFAHALTWLIKTMGKNMRSPGSEAELFKTTDGYGPSFLGYPYKKFEALALYVDINLMARQFHKAGKTADDVKSNVVSPPVNHARDAAPTADAAQKAASQGGSLRQELYRKIAEQSETFMRLLLAGDLRFLQAAGLNSITDLPFAAQTLAPIAAATPSMAGMPKPSKLPAASALHALPADPVKSFSLPTLPPSPTNIDG